MDGMGWVLWGFTTSSSVYLVTLHGEWALCMICGVFWQVA